MQFSNDIHKLFLAHTYETGASVWACADCEFVCIIKDDKTISIHNGDDMVYHVTQEELDNFMPNHAISHEFAGADVLQDNAIGAWDAYHRKYGDVVDTAFFDWIAAHREQLESL